MAHLLMLMPTSLTNSTRETVKLLRFLEALHTEGVEWVPLDAIAFECATKDKEGPWGREAHRIAQRAEPLTEQDKVGHVENTDEYRNVLHGRVTQLLASTPTAREEDLADICSTMIPGARKSRQENLQQILLEPYLGGDVDTVVEHICDNLFATRLESHLDMVNTAVQYRVAVGLLEVGPLGFRLSNFGTEALEHAPKKAPDVKTAWQQLRGVTVSPYEGRRQEREARLDEKRRYNTSEEGRLSLVGKIGWEQYRGRSLFAEYEATLVFSTLALLDPTSALAIADVARGIRTRLGFDLEAYAAAPGHDDGRIRGDARRHAAHRGFWYRR